MLSLNGTIGWPRTTSRKGLTLNAVALTPTSPRLLPIFLRVHTTRPIRQTSPSLRLSPPVSRLLETTSRQTRQQPKKEAPGLRPTPLQDPPQQTSPSLQGKKTGSPRPASPTSSGAQDPPRRKRPRRLIIRPLNQPREPSRLRGQHQVSSRPPSPLTVLSGGHFTQRGRH